MKKQSLSKVVLERIPIYLHYLLSDELKDVTNVSATTIAKGIKFGEVQVRKDLALLSGAGKAKVGYDKLELISTLREAMMGKNIRNAIIVGTGRIGKALLNYNGFEEYGIKIIAGFDINQTNDDSKTCKILDVNELPNFLSNNRVDVGIVTVPKDVAQQIFDLLVNNGIKAIWNFVPINPDVPNDVIVRNENLAASLTSLFEKLEND